MRELTFSVPEGYSGISLKSFLRNCCGVSARLMVRLKKEPMGITRNGRHAIVTEILEPGDVVRILLPDDQKQIEPVDAPLDIRYEDDDVLIVNKPAFMPMYPSPGHDRDSLANAVSAYYRGQEAPVGFRPIYRLDKDTSGIVVLAKNSFAAAKLAGKIQKDYFAICEGELNGEGTIDRPIDRKEGHAIQREVSQNGERAVTHWYSLGCGSGHSFLRLRLETGRTHQIRVHLSSMGHPLAGDDMYGGTTNLILRQALHCGMVSFEHPYFGESMCLFCELPNDMKSLLSCCGIQSVQKHE